MMLRTPQAARSTWPVFVALGLIALLLLAMLGADLIVARRVAARTTEIVGNSQRSIELVDDFRGQTHRLTLPELSPDEVTATMNRIAADVIAYDPLATSVGEREEWRHLRGLLLRFQDGYEYRRANPVLAAAIESSIDRLVSINGQASHVQVDAIHRIHEGAILADSLVGGLAFCLAALIAGVLLRVLGKQRLLVSEYVALIEERNRELDAFAGRAAHDLRVPLNPIRGYADLLALDTDASEDVREKASRIRVAVTRMSRVIDDMLELSRAGRPAPGFAFPGKVVAHVLDELAPVLQGARIVTEIEDAPIACGSSVLAQVVRNLLGNAAKFRAHERPLVVTIRTRREGAQVALTVEDNGMGLDRDAQSHAFEPYFRAYSAREIPGHGLGLAIVERVARALGGTCEIAPGTDVGTRVVVRLPGASSTTPVLSDAAAAPASSADVSIGDPKASGAEQGSNGHAHD